MAGHITHRRDEKCIQDYGQKTSKEEATQGRKLQIGFIWLRIQSNHRVLRIQ
jgi:hypothetical protein